MCKIPGRHTYYGKNLLRSVKAYKKKHSRSTLGRGMKQHLILCVVAQWVLVHGNPLDVCVMGNGRYLIEDKDLDMSQLVGNWYTLYVMPKNMTDVFTCAMSTHELNPNGNVNFLFSYYNQSIHQRQSSTASLKNEKTRVRYDFAKNTEFNGLYYILATDYKQFTLNGGCPTAWSGSHKIMWINFRSKDPSKAALNAAEEAVRQQGFEMSDFADFCPDKSQYF